MTVNWKSSRIVCYAPIVSAALWSQLLLLGGCGSDLYPDSGGYSYDAAKANADSNSKSGDSTKAGTSYGSKTPSPSSNPSKGTTSKTPSSDSKGSSGKTPSPDAGDAAADPKDSTDSGDVEDDPKQTPDKDPAPTPVLDGLALYTKKCGPCHGALGTSNIVNRSLAGMTTALGNVPAMAAVKASNDELAAIVEAFRSK